MFKLEIEVFYVLDMIKLLVDDMLDVFLIGFVGVLFILVSYMIEGGLLKNYY